MNSMSIVGGEARKLSLVRKPVQGVQEEGFLREASTGRVVTVTLPRVWAVAEGGPVLLEKAVPNVVPVSTGAETVEPERPPVELAFYRKYTEALLRRYLRLSMQAGRVPSMLSREVFRGQVTSYKVRGFEEVVIFCHDVEQRLAKLNATDQQLITKIALQRYSRGEAARILGLGVSACFQRYDQAVDRLTGLLLEASLLDEQLRR